MRGRKNTREKKDNKQRGERMERERQKKHKHTTEKTLDKKKNVKLYIKENEGR